MATRVTKLYMIASSNAKNGRHEAAMARASLNNACVCCECTRVQQSGSFEICGRSAKLLVIGLTAFNAALCLLCLSEKDKSLNFWNYAVAFT